MAFLLEKMVLLFLLRWLQSRAWWPTSKCRRLKYSTEFLNLSWTSFCTRPAKTFLWPEASDFNNINSLTIQFECSSRIPTWSLNASSPVFHCPHNPLPLSLRDPCRWSREEGRFQVERLRFWRKEWECTKESWQTSRRLMPGRSRQHGRCITSMKSTGSITRRWKGETLN